MRSRSLTAAKRLSGGACDEGLSVLYDTVSQLAATLDVQRASRLVIERARSLLGSDLAFIALRDPDDPLLRMLTCVGHRTAEFMGFARPVEQGIAVYERRPLYSADFLNDNRLSHHADTDARIRAEGIRSVLVVPLKAHDDVLGMLAVANRSVHSYTDREVLLLSELGAHAALALDNARRHADAVAAAARAMALSAETEGALRHVAGVQHLHDEMVEVLLAGHGVSGVLAVLREAFGVAVVATDWRHVVLGHGGAGGWVDGRGQLSRGLLGRPDVRRAMAACAGAEAPVVRGGCLVARIAAAGETLGYLWLPAVDGVVPPDRRDLLGPAVQRAARLLALELIRGRVAVETERRFGRDFLLNLLSDASADPMTQESLARQVWRRYGAPHRPLTVRVATLGRDAPVPVERARGLLAEAREGDLVAVHRGAIVVMLGEVERTRAESEVVRLRALLAEHGLDSSVVIGDVCRDLAEDRSCILACLHLHELLERGPLLWLEELRPLTILFDPGQRDRLDRFVRSVLQPLEGRPELISTLRGYHLARGNRAEAARRLRVHVNTLRYRLERIEALLGQSVDDPAGAGAVQLAVAVHDRTLADSSRKSARDL